MRDFGIVTELTWFTKQTAPWGDSRKSFSAVSGSRWVAEAQAALWGEGVGSFHSVALNLSPPSYGRDYFCLRHSCQGVKEDRKGNRSFWSQASPQKFTKTRIAGMAGGVDPAPVTHQKVLPVQTRPISHFSPPCRFPLYKGNAWFISLMSWKKQGSENAKISLFSQS